MSSNPDELRRQLPSTYFVRDRADSNEMARLDIQEELITDGMGGVLPEQPDPDKLKRILDIACGTGGWLIRAAKTYPGMTRLVGVDVNAHLIKHAQERAQAEQVSDRVEFHVMDALLLLEFPKGYFDLVNLRSATSFMRTWNWPKMLREMQRVARPGGVVRITENLRMHSSSPAVIRLMGLFGEAFFNAGHLYSEAKTEETFTEGSAGIANELPRLMDQYGFHDIQTRISTGHYRPDTPGGQQYIEDLRLSGKNMIPFIRKWGRMPNDYDALCQQAVEATQQPGFSGSWEMLTVWGTTTI